MDISFFEKFANRQTIAHLLKNYSEGSIGIRHPNNPCGIVTRDSGMTDVYAGKSRLILDVSGNVLLKGNRIGLTSAEVYLNSSSISTLKIVGKTTNTDIFNGQLITALKSGADLSDKYFLSGKTVILDSQGGMCTLMLKAEDSVLNSLDLKLLYEVSDEKIPHPLLSIAGIIADTLGVK